MYVRHGLAFRLCCLLVIFAGSNITCFARLSLNREAGAIYLEDLLDKPVTIPVAKPTAIYYDITLKRYLGTLRTGQSLELQAIADHAYRVRGKAQQGQVVGWVSSAAVDSLKPEFVQAMKSAAERHARVQDLIAKNEVAMGMTGEEVLLSLGKPQKKSTRVDAGGREEIWEYISYRRVPERQSYLDRYNRLAYRTVYVNVPDGQMTVIMKNNIVNAVEESEGNLVEDRGARIVVPPIDIIY